MFWGILVCPGVIRLTAVKVTTVFSSCLLNLGNCLLLFINKVTLKTGMELYKED